VVWEYIQTLGHGWVQVSIGREDNELLRPITDRALVQGGGETMSKGIRGKAQPGTARRSRREILAGAVGVIGVLGAGVITRPLTAQATQGMPIIAGQSNDETSPTSIHNTTGGDALTGVGHGGGTGLIGQGGSLNGVGVAGVGLNAIGVSGFGDIGVEGAANIGTPNRLGVRGRADGVSGGTGVIGLASDGSGVVGKSQSGSGVYGVAGNYSGASASGAVVGDSTTSAGVVGFTSAASRAAAEFTHVAGKTALKVTGLSVFSRSGKVAIKDTAKAATVTGVPLTASSLILATVQNSVGVWVASAVPNLPGSSFTINLNAAPGTGHTAQVAWFVVN
jgi:hypothetical protein